MRLVTGKEILEAAHRGGYTIGVCNINNMEILQGVAAGCMETQSLVIIAVSEGAMKRVLAEDRRVFDPRKILGQARDMITEVVKDKVKLFGCEGKAREVMV